MLLTVFITFCIVRAVRAFKEIIEAWPEPAVETFAVDVGAKVGTANQWRNRDVLPARVWKKTVRAARRRGLRGVTYERLATLAEQRAAA